MIMIPGTSNKFCRTFRFSGAFRFSVYFSKCPANSKQPAFSSCDGGSLSLNIKFLPGIEHAPPLLGSGHFTNVPWKLYTVGVLGSI
jgi:hypothetical protein